MKKSYLLIFLFLAFSAGLYAQDSLKLTQEERAWIQGHQTIRVTGAINYPPNTFRDDSGNPSGYSVDYLGLIALKTGLRLVFMEEDNPGKCLESLKNKEAELSLALTQTPERNGYILFSKVYNENEAGIAVQSAYPGGSVGISDILLKRLIVPEGFFYSEYLGSAYRSFRFLTASTPKDALKAVMFGEADFALGDRSALEYLIHNLKLEGLKVLPVRDAPKLTNFDRFGIRDDMPVLQSIVNKAIDSVPAKEKAALAAKWFSYERDIPLSPQERDFLEAMGSIRFVTDPSWMPFSEIGKNGSYSGISADYFKLFSERLKIPFTLIPTSSWEESVEKIKNGEADVLTVVADISERRSYLNFTKEFLKNTPVVVTRNDKLYIGDFRQVVNEKIGVVSGFSVKSLLKDKYPGIDIVEVRDIPAGLMQVASGDLFAMVDDLSTISYYLTREKFTTLKISGQIPVSMTYAIGVKKDKPRLAAIMDKAIDSITEEDRRSIDEKWISVRFDHGYDMDTILKILAVPAGIILLGIWRYFIVQGKNRELKILNDKLERVSVTDNLTGLFNRLKGNDALDAEYARFGRQNIPFAVLILDIDRFKDINDTFGHPAGDAVLVKVAGTIRETVRNMDVAIRWGGEEFLVISPATDESAAVILGERLRSAVACADFTVNREITVSIGTAVSRQGESISDLIKRADIALYKAKEGGRNRVKAG